MDIKAALDEINEAAAKQPKASYTLRSRWRARWQPGRLRRSRRISSGRTIRPS